MNIRKKFWSQIVVIKIFGITFLIVGAVGIITQINNISKYKAQISTIQSEMKMLEKEIVETEKLKEENDLERIARETLKMVKPNEIIYIEK